MKKLTRTLAALCALALAVNAYAQDHKWKFVATGDGTTHAIDKDGSLWAWGWNEPIRGKCNGPNGRTLSNHFGVVLCTGTGGRIVVGNGKDENLTRQENSRQITFRRRTWRKYGL